MKNEGRIMEAKDMDLGSKEKSVKRSAEKSANPEELNPVVNRGDRVTPHGQPNEKGPRKYVQSGLDQFGVKELVEERDVSESMKDQSWKDKVTPEIVEELKKLKDFSVDVEINGEKKTKTGQDVLEAMGRLGKEDLTLEQKFMEMQEASKIHTKLMQEYEAGTEKGDKLRGIFENEVMGVKSEKAEKGAEKRGEVQNLFEQIAKGDATAINKLVEKMGVKFDERMRNEFNGLIKKLLPSEVVEAAPMVTVGDNGQITITPAPQGEGGGISKTPETPGKPREEGKGEGEEECKFDWYKYGNYFLLLLILYIGAQGWYAKMWEQFAERAR